MFSLAQPFLPVAEPSPQGEGLRRPRQGADRALDDLLGEAPAVGSAIEVSGASSSGKSTFAMHLCLAALREGRAAGWIDSGQGFHPLAPLESGDPLDRLLVVRVPDGAGALRAADLLLSVPGAVAVAVVSLPPGFKPPESALVRLQRLAERSATTLVFLDEQSARAASLGAPIALRLCVQRPAAPEGTSWSLSLEVTRHKGGACGPLDQELPHGPDRLRLHRTV
jgi:hypothetical protein